MPCSQPLNFLITKAHNSDSDLLLNGIINLQLTVKTDDIGKKSEAKTFLKIVCFDFTESEVVESGGILSTFRNGLHVCE